MVFLQFREELKEKYEGKITQEMDGPIYEIVSRLMKAVVGRRITVPGTFKRCINVMCFWCSKIVFCYSGYGDWLLIIPAKRIFGQQSLTL